MLLSCLTPKQVKKLKEENTALCEALKKLESKGTGDDSVGSAAAENKDMDICMAVVASGYFFLHH